MEGHRLRLYELCIGMRLAIMPVCGLPTFSLILQFFRHLNILLSSLLSVSSVVQNFS